MQSKTKAKLSTVIDCEWVDRQACSLSRYINVIDNDDDDDDFYLWHRILEA